jgi:predicted Zn-dependent protease with MMP-like domain
MEREKFEALVEEALADIPPRFKDLLQNIAVIVESRPPRGQRLLGLYHGVPFKYRGPDYGNVAPDVIVIYQWPIEHLAANDNEIREEVRMTVLHEVGHYFGLDEKTLRDIEHEMRNRSR